MNEAQYKKLQEVIQQANPEIMGNWCFCPCCNQPCENCLSDKSSKPETYNRPIRLADVMIAIEKATKPPEKYTVSTNGIITFRESKEITAQVLNSRFLSTGISWNLHNDNLDNQSHECKIFLAELLT